MALRFTKIKYDGKKVELSWTTKTEHDEVDHHIAAAETAAERFVKGERAQQSLALER